MMNEVRVDRKTVWKVGKKRVVKRVMKKRLKANSSQLTAKSKIKTLNHEEHEGTKVHEEEQKANSYQLTAKSLEPYLRKVNREWELEKLLGLSRLLGERLMVVWTYPACVGLLEEISYYTEEIPDPIILVSWWSTAERFNEVMAGFQKLRQDGQALASEGIKFWEGKILPEAILAGFDRDQIRFVREWVKDIIETVDVIPVPERRVQRVGRYSWENLERW